MNRLSILIFLIVLSFGIMAQNATQAGKKVKSNEPGTDYDRAALTYLLLDFGSGSHYDLLKHGFLQAKTDDKFDDNSLSNPFLPAGLTRQELLSQFALNPRVPDNASSRIQDALVKNHSANAVVSKWFSRRSDGSFGVELLQQRGLYNATDADVVSAEASKLGKAKLMDAGEKLLNNSFIVVYDVYDLIDMEEAYTRQEKASKTTVKHDKNGFKATVFAYVYKINFNDTINSIFWQQLWANPGDPDLAARRAAFDRFNFPVSYYTRSAAMVEASQPNPGQMLAPKVQATKDELMLKLLDQGIKNNLEVLEKNLEEFKVKTSLFGTNPLVAKIGRKEGLKPDHRYFVYEMVQNNDGQINAERRGVIRATSNIVDNRQVATGQSKTSQFYQVAGGRLDEGMLLRQRNDAGISLTLGYAFGGVGGPDLRADFNLTRLLGTKMPSMVKIYLEGGYDFKSKDIAIGETGTFSYKDFVRYGGGVAKEFCFAHHFKFQPFAGFGLEKISRKDDSEKYFSALYGHFGTIFGFNIQHNIQLTWQLSDYFMGSKITDQDNTAYTIDGSDKWGAAFGRGGIANTIGIRFEF
jgi:hypothetical protein